MLTFAETAACHPQVCLVHSDAFFTLAIELQRTEGNNQVMDIQQPVEADID